MKNSAFLVSFLLIFCKSFFASGQCNDLIKIREMCSVAYQKNNTTEIDSVLKLSGYSNTIYTGYRSVVLMLHAKISNSPFDKMKYFNKGKNLLESTIEKDYKNIELRYLRFCIQTNIPFFLFYSSNIETDKKFIIENWNYLADEDLKNRIKKYMALSEHCTSIEKNFFLNG